MKKHGYVTSTLQLLPSYARSQRVPLEDIATDYETALRAKAQEPKSNWGTVVPVGAAIGAIPGTFFWGNFA